jgi:hypothetical protein
MNCHIILSFEYPNIGQISTRTLQHLCETFLNQDKSAPGQFGTSIRQIGLSKRQIGTFLIMSVPEKILIMRSLNLRSKAVIKCLQLVFALVIV